MTDERATEIEIADQQSALAVDVARVKEVVTAILGDHVSKNARISIAIVDDATIHQLNRQYLQHDYATDVLSFLLDDNEILEGEVIVSAEMAVSQAAELGWAEENELLLYIVHGVLHLVGFDDQSAEAQQRMQQAERSYLAALGISRR